MQYLWSHQSKEVMIFIYSMYFEVLSKSSFKIKKVYLFNVLLPPSPWEHTHRSQHICHDQKLFYKSFCVSVFNTTCDSAWISSMMSNLCLWTWLSSWKKVEKGGGGVIFLDTQNCTMCGYSVMMVHLIFYALSAWLFLPYVLPSLLQDVAAELCTDGLSRRD